MNANFETRTPLLRFDPGDLARIMGVDHSYERPTDGGHVLRRHGCPVEISVTHAEMAAFSRAADFIHRRGHFLETGAAARARSGVERLADIPKTELPVVMHRLWWVEKALAAEANGYDVEPAGGGTTVKVRLARSDSSMTAFVKAMRDENESHQYGLFDEEGMPRKPRASTKVNSLFAPEGSTLRRWIKIYEEGGCKAHALRTLHRHCGNRTIRLEAEVYALVTRIAARYASEKRPHVTTLHADLEIALRALNAERAGEGLEPLALPSIKVLRKAVKALPAFCTYAARRGLAAARKRFLLVKGSNDADRPGERIEMDEWRAHVQLILEKRDIWRHLGEAERRAFSGRLHVNFAEDVATRCILGIAIGSTATSALALTALRSVTSDKTAIAAAAGCRTRWDMALSPELVVTDGGSAFVSDDFVAAVRDLQSGHDVPPSGQPEKRGHEERFNRRVDQQFLPSFSARTFTGVEDKGDYDAQLRASLTVEEFGKALVRWIVDVYHNTPHAGLGGETPLEAWKRLDGLYHHIAPPAADAARVVFGVEVERRVSLRGVRIAGLFYGDEELGRAILQRGLEEVTVRFDPQDLGAVSLRVGTGWRRLPCRMEGLEGVDLETWTKAAADLRRRFRDQAAISRDVVLDAIEAIQAIAAQAEARVGIDRLAPDAAAMTRVEQELLSGFELPRGTDDDAPDGSASGGGDPLARAIPTGGGAPPPTDPPTVAAAGDEPPEETPRLPPRASRAAAPTTPPDDAFDIPNDIEIED